MTVDDLTKGQLESFKGWCYVCMGDRVNKFDDEHFLSIIRHFAKPVEDTLVYSFCLGVPSLVKKKRLRRFTFFPDGRIERKTIYDEQT